MSKVLWLQVCHSGSKSWVFRFTAAGKGREMGLGGLDAVSLGIARERAHQCRLLLSEGEDPIVARNASRTSDALRIAHLRTFDQCAAACIGAYRASWTNAEHAAQWESSLSNYASPVLGALPVAPVVNFPALPWRDVAAFIQNLRAGAWRRERRNSILTACRS